MIQDLDIDSLAGEALKLLADGDLTGRVRDRDTGLLLAAATLESAASDWPARSKITRASAYALRRRYRWDMEPNDLSRAIAMLETALVNERRAVERSLLLSELVVTQMRWWLASDAAQMERTAQQDRWREAAISLASSMANRAALLGQADPGARARSLYARGMIANGSGNSEGAVALLREAVALAPDDPEVRNDFARALCDSPIAEEQADGFDYLTRLAVEWATARPRDAFEVNRFLAFAASQHGDSARVCTSLVAAVNARELARTIAGSDANQQRWLRATFAIHSDTARALMEVGDLAGSVHALERGAALELRERLAETLPDDPLEAGEVLLYTVVTASAGAVLMVAGGRIQRVDLAVARPDTTQCVLSYVTAYQEWRMGGDSPSARRAWMIALDNTIRWLRESIVDPVLAVIPDGTSTVTIVPDGTIGLLPLHAAFLSAAPDSAVRYAACSSSLFRSRRSERPLHALIVAEPSIQGAPALEFAHVEADAVAASFEESTRLSGDDATVEAIELELPLRGLVHLAAHGRNRADIPDASAILLAGGEGLTVARIMSMRLVRARLVVLSACETAMQDVSLPEERLGLPLAFLQAGSPGVIASMWAVGDASTAILMARFYEEWQIRPDPVAALSRAQTWMRTVTRGDLHKWIEKSRLPEIMGSYVGFGPEEHLPFDQPHHWAGFAYFGT